MKESKYIHLCIKDLYGEISEEEKLELSRWLKKSKKNQTEYNRLLQIKEKQNQMKMDYTSNVDIGWNNIESRIGSKRDKMSIVGHIHTFFQELFVIHYKPAIAGGGFIAAGLIFLLLLHSPLFQKEMMTVYTKNRQIKDILLPDGSQIKLNHGSRIQYDKNFDSLERIVYLTGEAFFEIVKDERSFIVSSSNAKVEVLGTKFNVYSRDKKTSVIVKEGVVLLASLTNKNEYVELTRNQMSEVILTDKPKNAKQVNTDYLLGWIEGKLIFDKIPLTKAIEEIERYYDISISLDQKLNGRMLTAQFENSTIEDVLKKICLAFNATYAYRSNGFEIYSN